MPRQQNLRQGMDLVAPGGKKWGPGLPNATAPGSSSMDTSTTWAPRTRSPMPASPWGRRRPGFRFHDLRHTGLTRYALAGCGDQGAHGPRRPQGHADRHALPARRAKAGTAAHQPAGRHHLGGTSPLSRASRRRRIAVDRLTPNCSWISSSLPRRL